jgi:isoleucyl-tRNA synthetase
MAIKVSSLGRAARSGANIKVRQPLAKVVVATKSKTDREGLMNLKPQVLEELNVKDIEFTDTIAELEKAGYAVMTEGDLGVGVCTEVSPELEMEGMAREIVHRIQTMRKSAGFEIADYIATYFEGDEYILKVMQDPVSAEYVKQETLSHQIAEGVPEHGAFAESFKLNGHAMRLGVKKESE